ncbi:hypothetical protein [Flavobacterium channae]|uniref:hypothetical protein n=1 Tax=Flavobacterium channae TaxID=2897181 RepID=UPI001E4BC186|nr:hypothetical protein [Flavobacterium channae]UGS22559.1 hypothetical protein LOS89_07170 [Flavobacterium channae]
MKKAIIIILLLGINLCYSQNSNDINFRFIKGIIEDNFGPVAGANILVKGTPYYVTTDYDGIFCLVVPVEKNIYIEVSAMSRPVIVKIQPKNNKVKININKKVNNNKTYKKFIKENEEYIAFLNEFYSNPSILEITNNCDR